MGPEIAIVAVVLIALGAGFGIGAIGNLIGRAGRALDRAEPRDRGHGA